MPKKLKVSDSGDELEIPQDHIIEVSYSKARQMMKKPREMSEKQRENIQRLVESNRKKKEERDALKAQQEAERVKPPTQKIVVKPKRVFKKQELPTSNEYIEQKIKQQQYEEESEEEDDDYEQQSEIDLKPIKPIVRPKPTRPIPIPQNPKSNAKLVEMENKLKQIEQSINKPVQQNKYSSMYSSFFGKK